MTSHSKLFFFAASASVLLSAGTQAQVLLSETFPNDGGLTTTPQDNGWTNEQGPVGEQNVTGGRLFLNDDETEDTYVFLDDFVFSGTITATFQLEIDINDTPSSAAGEFFTSFRSNSGGLFGRVFTLAPVDSTANAFRLGVSSGTSSANAIFSMAFTAGTVYDLTLTYDFATDLTTLSVPGFGSITSTDAADTSNIGSYSFRQTAMSGDMFIDNLLVVPEPSTYALLGIGLLVCVKRVRRSLLSK